MNRLIRIVGFLLLGAGAVVLLTWSIRPLRSIWPWIRGLPPAIQIGISVAAVGLILLMGSLLWERIEERDKDRELLDDRPDSHMG